MIDPEPTRTEGDHASVYAPERVVDNLDDCLWYHTMEIPGYGLVEGQWDLRGGEDSYTGNVDVAGKRVLEVGTASGFVCRHLEGKGAEVVSYDLSENQKWDVVPYAYVDVDSIINQRKALVRSLNNGWWLTHRVFGSRARVVYGTAYDIPVEIGTVDVALYGAILLHLRDPFLALYNGLRLTRETAIVTEIVNNRRPSVADGGVAPDGRPSMEFLPDWTLGAPLDTWWFLTPEVVQNFLGVLGFGITEVSFHTQKAYGADHEFFTVVGHRTSGTPEGS